MNRTHSWLDYRERLDRIIRHIHDHLHHPLDLQALADIAHLSPYHWHRVYQGLFGESLTHTVRRLRLHRASGDLLHSQTPVSTIAQRWGYPNVQSFSRAFGQQYGCSPRAFRNQGQPQPLSPPLTQRPSHQTVHHEVTVKEVPLVHVAGFTHRGSYMQMGKAFGLAHTHMAAQGLMSPNTRWLAVYHDDPWLVPESQLCSQAGLSWSDQAPQSPLETWTLGGCLCAVLHYRGPYAHMRAAYEWLHGHWLVESGLTAGDQPVFEEYLNHPSHTAPADLRTDIYLPLAG